MSLPLPYAKQRVKYADTVASILTDIGDIQDLDTVVTRSYAIEGDNGGNEYIFHDNGILPNEVDPGFNIDLGDFKWLEAVNQTVARAAQFGDGVDAPQSCLDVQQVTSGCRTVEFTPEKTYEMTSSLAATLTKDVEIKGNGATLRHVGSHVLSLNTEAVLTTSLQLPVAYNSKTVTLNSVAGISVGDVMLIRSNAQPFLPDRPYNALDVRRVVSITGNEVELFGAANFNYTLGGDVQVGWDSVPIIGAEVVTVTVYKGVRSKINDLNCAGAADNFSCFGLGGHGSDITNCRAIGETSAARGFVSTFCESVTYDGCRVDDCYYAGLNVGSRNVTVRNHTAANASNPFDDGDCASDLLYENVKISSGISNYATASHSGFRVTWKQVEADNVDIDCRAFGLRLKDVRVTTPTTSTIYTSIGFRAGSVDTTTQPHLETDYDYVFENVDFLPAAQVDGPYILFQGASRNVRVNNCRLPALYFEEPIYEQCTVTNSRFGWFSVRAPKTPQPLYIDNCVIDGNLCTVRANMCDMSTDATSMSPVFLSNVKCINNDPTGTLFGICNMYDFQAVNCNFGKWAEFADSGSGPFNNYLFANCKLEIEADQYMNADLSKFVGCSGFLAGIPLDPGTYGLNDPTLTSMQQGDGNTDGTPDANDYSFSQNNGDWVGNSAYGSGPQGAATPSFLFTGSSYIQLQNVVAGCGVPWTYSCWFMTTDPEQPITPQNIFSDGSNGKGCQAVILNLNNQPALVFYDSPQLALHFAAYLVRDTWYHMALVCDGVNTQAYLNGAAVGGVWAASFVSPEISLVIGHPEPQVGSQEFIGEIWDVRQYAKAYTASEINSELYKIPPPGASLGGNIVVDEIKTPSAPPLDYQIPQGTSTEDLDYTTGPRNKRLAIISDVTVTLAAFDPGWYTVVIVQDATGGHTITWPAGIQGVPPYIDPTPNSYTTVSLFYDTGVWAWPAVDSYYAYDKRTNIVIPDDNFVEIGNLVTDNDFQAGTYEIKFSFSYTYDTTTQSAQMQFRIDGGVWNTFSRENKDIGDKYAVYYAYPTVFSAGVHTIELQIAKDGAGDNMTVDFADTILERKL